jgi:hypothetical protein
MDELFGYADDDNLSLDEAQLEQIEMLERYRQNLVAASNNHGGAKPDLSQHGGGKGEGEVQDPAVMEAGGKTGDKDWSMGTVSLCVFLFVRARVRAF